MSEYRRTSFEENECKPMRFEENSAKDIFAWENVEKGRTDG